MNVVQVNQPVATRSTQATVMRRNNWSSGVCDCCEDCSVCCCALWCCPCFQCQTVSEFEECLCLPLFDLLCMAFTGSFAVGFYVGLAMGVPVTVTPCPPISMAMRSGVRERYKIQGSICDDCCMLLFCYCCSWCQMAREIKKRKQPFSVVTAQTTTVQTPQPSSDGMAHQIPLPSSDGMAHQMPPPYSDRMAHQMPPPYSDCMAQAVQQYK